MSEPGQGDRGKQLLKALFGTTDDNVHKLEFIATCWLGLGALFVVFTTALGIAHFGFDVPIRDKQTHAPAEPAALLRVFALFIGVGLAFAVAGQWIRRVCGRWYETD